MKFGKPSGVEWRSAPLQGDVEMDPTPGKILVMQTGGWIGDMILLTPAVRALRAAFPPAKISMLVNPLVGDLMKRNPYLTHVIVYDKRGKQKGVRQMLRMVRTLKQMGFDLAVILHPNSTRTAFMAFLAGIPKRLATHTISRGPFLTTSVPKEKDVHEVQRYLSVVAPVVGANVDDRLEFWGISPEDENFADSVLCGAAQPVVGINPGTTWQSKQWLPQRFALVAEHVARDLGGTVLLTGSSTDVHVADSTMNSIDPSIRGAVLNLAGKTTLWQLGALVKRCDFYVSADSGPMHISAALGTRTIALFGPTDPARHGPHGVGHQVIRKDMPCSPCYRRKCKSRKCMLAIQAEDVTRCLA